MNSLRALLLVVVCLLGLSCSERSAPGERLGSIEQRVDFDAGSINGTVSWNGSAVGGLEGYGLFAQVTSASQPNAAFSYIGQDGSLSIPAVSPGTYDVNIYQNGCTQPDGLVGTKQALDVLADQSADGNIDLTATAGRVIGSITVNGSPVDQPGVSIDALCGEWGSGNAGQFGHFLKPGSYTATVRVGSARLGTFDFTVLAGQTTDVDIGTTLAGPDREVQLSGGIGEIGGISLVFSEVLQSGQTTVVESGSGPPPDTGFRIVGLSNDPNSEVPRYWDINTTAGYTGPITVCIHYDPAEVQGNVSNLELRHHDGSKWEKITTTHDEDANIICGTAFSLSPFAVFEPIVTVVDQDADGVADSADSCPTTAAGAAVDAAGCSVADLCPCQGSWRNHGKYVACVSQAVEAFTRARIISPREAARTLVTAALSKCGK